MRIGYARVSTEDQSLNLQRDALDAAGCARRYEDRLSGCARNRPGLEAALTGLTPGDTLVVWRLDRLGRLLPDLIELVARLQEKGCGFHSLTEAIDTSSAGGKLVFHIMGALAEFERRLIGERTKAGLAAARARGVALGREPKLTRAQVEDAAAQLSSGIAAEDLARRFGVGRSTLYRYLKAARIETGSAPYQGHRAASPDRPADRSG